MLNTYKTKKLYQDYLYIYIYIYIHTHTYTHTHIYIINMKEACNPIDKWQKPLMITPQKCLIEEPVKISAVV